MIFNSLILFLIIQAADSNECGISELAYSPRQFIIGGENAEPGEFPWFVEFYFKANTTDKWDQGCGGALIADDWVITAGHCVQDNIPGVQIEWDAYLNVTDLDNSDIHEHHVEVLKVIKHEEFENVYDKEKEIFNLKNDIALVKIKGKSVANRSKPMPICLPDENVSMLNECWIAGFGLADNKINKYSRKLNKLKDWVNNDQECLKHLKSFNSTQELCIGGTGKGGKGACYGDSGSAFICKGMNNKFYQLGITSHTANVNGNCAEPNTPDVYTRVSHYMTWIQDTIDRYR